MGYPDPHLPMTDMIFCLTMFPSSPNLIKTT